MGAVSWFGVEKMGDQKTYFVVMQDNFNATTSCDHFSIIYTHKKLKRNLELKQNKKFIECNVFFFFFFCLFVCFKFPERCGYFELKRNKCDVPIYGSMFSRRK